MFSGKFEAKMIPIVTSTLGMSSILICYWLAQLYHHEKPFPHSTISATAQHYPEFVFFRIGTIAGTVLLILSYFLNYFWIYQIGYENTFPVSKYKPQISLILGIMGGLFFTGSTATLDTGKHNTNWHVTCAVCTFAFNIFAQVYNSVVVFILAQKKLNGISQTSAYIKLVLGILTFAQMIVDINAKDHMLSNFLEYSLAFSLYTFFFIIAYDIRNFSLVYVKSA